MKKSKTKNLEKKLDFPTIFNEILKIDQKIRFVTICDLHGRIAHTGHKKGIKSMLEPEESAKALKHAAKSWTLRNEISHKIGKGKYALVVYENLKRITIPLKTQHLLYLTTDVNADHSRIIDQVLKLIEGKK